MLIAGTDCKSAPSGYDYDDNGNMRRDANKGINSITYNHLNLSVEIIFDETHKIEYLYDGTGIKVQKKVTNDALIAITDYLDGFQYTNGLLNFFPHAEGYVNVTICGRCEKNNQNVYDYVFNYTDHLGNVRMSWAVDKTTNLLKIVEENHYYPFGLKHTHYNVDHKHFQLLTPEEGGPIPGDIPMTKMAQLIGSNNSSTASVTNNYKYNGKEFQDELGLNMYDYGAMFYDPALGRRNNIDPKAETSRRWTLYSYCYDNPMRFVDPDGMQAFDVILKGTEKQAAFTELQKSVQGQLNLSMDTNGKVSYSNIQGTTPNADAQKLVTAIDDHSVTVNVTAENTKFNSTGNLYIGGAFMGNTVTTSPSGNTVSTNQEINPSVLSAADNYYGTSGSLTLHEVTESYIGGVNAKQTGVSVGPATKADADNPTSAYNIAHNAAAPQNMVITQRAYDSSGNEVFQPYPANTVRADFSVQQGNRVPLVIMSIP